MASGTFDATGAGPAVIISERADLSIEFEGTGTVSLQRYIRDDWRDTGNEFTEDTEDIVYSGSNDRQYRLNCTARSADIHWHLGGDL